MSRAKTTTGILMLRRPLVDPPSAVAVTASAQFADDHTLTEITSAAHGLTPGSRVTLAGHTGSVPALNGDWLVEDVIDDTHFLLPIALTTPGTGGTLDTVYTAVAEIRDIGPGGKSRNKLETSIHNEGSESHTLGIIRQKDPTLKINLLGDDPTHQTIDDDFNNNVRARWLIAFPSGMEREGDARVQAFDYDGAPVDGIQGATITLTWATAVTERRVAPAGLNNPTQPGL